jgi:hypothetical protein
MLFNPVYGQGMTVAALEALALRRLPTGGVPQPRRYFRDIARLVDAAWDMAVGGDLAFPQVPGPRPMKVRLINAYLARLQAAAASDASLATAFIRVVGMLDPTPRPCSALTGSSARCAHRATPSARPARALRRRQCPPPRTADPHPRLLAPRAAGLPLHRPDLQRTYRSDQPPDQEGKARRTRPPQLRQLPAAPAAALRRRMANSRRHLSRPAAPRRKCPCERRSA